MRNLWAFLGSNWQLMAIVAAVSALLSVYGTNKVVSFYYNAKITEAEALHSAGIIEAQQQSAKVTDARQRRTNEVANEYENRITDLQQRYNAEFDRLRLEPDTVGTSCVSDNTAGTCKCDASASRNRFSKRTQENLLKLMQKADEQTRRLVACQAWAKSLQENQ